MATPSKPKLDVVVTKPTPYIFDLGLLLASDPNPLTTSTIPDDAASAPNTSALEAQLAATARDGAQALVNQLLSTLPVSATSSGVLLSLPSSTTTPLPREKPVPAAKPPTKWEQFAARKGIKPRTREQRRARTQRYDEASGAWERTWGHDRGGQARRREDGAVPGDWVVEVDEKKEREEREQAARGRGKNKKRRKT
ncbi:ribosomal biogenesis regulatory protein [Hypoxylon sp. FL1284]|nr:ribosomal biogenesis regulatory protein [Hypoxylon sp. FL1284]